MACPYIHRNDERCYLQHDSQEGIDLAYKFCYDRYRDCRIFEQFDAETTSVRSPQHPQAPQRPHPPHLEDRPKPTPTGTEVKHEDPPPYYREGSQGGPPPEVDPTPADPDLERVKQAFREVLREMEREGEEELGARWRGGTLVLRPRDASLATKDLPIEVFFGKLIMIRDRLRVLEQKVNGHDKLSIEDKVAIQQYVTRCYGSLTTFNVLFGDRSGWFVGERGS